MNYCFFHKLSKLKVLLPETYTFENTISTTIYYILYYTITVNSVELAGRSITDRRTNVVTLVLQTKRTYLSLSPDSDVVSVLVRFTCK